MGPMTWGCKACARCHRASVGRTVAFDLGCAASEQRKSCTPWCRSCVWAGGRAKPTAGAALRQSLSTQLPTGARHPDVRSVKRQGRREGDVTAGSEGADQATVASALCSVQLCTEVTDLIIRISIMQSRIIFQSRRVGGRRLRL